MPFARADRAPRRPLPRRRGGRRCFSISAAIGTPYAASPTLSVDQENHQLEVGQQVASHILINYEHTPAVVKPHIKARAPDEPTVRVDEPRQQDSEPCERRNARRSRKHIGRRGIRGPERRTDSSTVGDTSPRDAFPASPSLVHGSEPASPSRGSMVRYVRSGASPASSSLVRGSWLGSSARRGRVMTRLIQRSKFTVTLRLRECR